MTDSGERTRLLIAVGSALAIHALLFVLVPLANLAEREALSPPLYVSLAPVRPVPEEVPEDVPEDPPREEAPAPETVSEPDPELGGAGDAAADAPPAASAPREPDGVQSDGEPANPGPAAPADPPPNPAADRFVPDEPDTPAAPRERAFGDLDSSLDTPGPADPDFTAEQIAQFNEFSTANRAALEAYNARQAARAGDQESPAASPDQSPADSALRSRLDALLEGIRQSSDNVVAAGPATPAEDPDAPDTGDTPGGVSIGEGAGSRRRVDTARLSLDGAVLPPGFPPEYPVQVVFSVSPTGVVSSPRVDPPTPEPDLNDAIENFVRSWRFEPAAAAEAGTVTGRVTIIVQTR